MIMEADYEILCGCSLRVHLHGCHWCCMLQMTQAALQSIAHSGVHGFLLGLSCRSRYFLPSEIITYGAIGSCLQEGYDKCCQNYIAGCSATNKSIAQHACSIYHCSERMQHTQLGTGCRPTFAAMQASLSAALS